MEPIALFVEHEPDYTMEQYYNTTITTKDQMDTVEMNNDVDDWLPGPFDLMADKTHRMTFLNRRSKLRQCKRDGKDVERHSSLSKWSE